MQPALLERGHPVLVHFVAELTPNDYPRLPVIQDPALLVVLSAYRDREHYAAMRNDWSSSGTVERGEMDALMTADVATMCLRPTARSLIRYERNSRR